MFMMKLFDNDLPLDEDFEASAHNQSFISASSDDSGFEMRV